MKPNVLALADPNTTLENVGGKGLSLAKLVNAGLPVPGGFHITTEAYCQFVAENGIQAQISAALLDVNAADPASLNSASQKIRCYFMEGRTPPAIAQAITEQYSALKNAPVAVRSSATAEDLPGASFAGQQETYLNIRGTEAVLQAVKKCWSSLWTDRAIAYRMKNAVDQDTVALAVVIQEMVFAEAAGIMFTANPITGKRDELLINAAWGLGEAIVSGVVTPDTLILKKGNGRVIHRETAEKSVMTIWTEAGTREQAVPDSKKKKPVLTNAQAAELAQLGLKIEQFYQMPMDVEWALAGGQFFIVQARPVTALPPEWKIPDPTAVYARGSLAEHIPSPVTPLFATFGLEVANAGTAKLWEEIVGKDAKKLLVMESGFYMPINGYVFGGIRMRGKHLLKILKMSIAQISPILRGSVARWQAARQEFAAVVDEWEQKPVELFKPHELLEGVRVVFGAAVHYFTRIQTTLPAASSSEALFSRFYNSLIRRKQDPEATVFLLGSDNAAVRAEKSLFDIATWIKEKPALANYMITTRTESLLEDFRQETAPQSLPPDLWAELRTRFQHHLGEFGRTAYEFDFVNPTPQETPGPMLDALKAFVEGTAPDPYKRQAEAVEKRAQATQAVLNRTGWPRRGWFRKLLRWAQETAPMREDSIFDMGMGHPLIRRMFAELGRRFAAQGAIEQAEDIYWLEKTEVEDLVAGLENGKPLPVYADRIPGRKEAWQAALKLTPPVMLPEKSGWSKFVHGGEAEKKDGKIVLKGIGTSRGSVTAPACVMISPEDFKKMKPGDVLVAVTTTPAWTPLFALASAVVTDIGGPLSHSSIVAREYGIPAVMAARTATRYIKNGQTVTVDGSKGTVILE